MTDPAPYVDVRRPPLRWKVREDVKNLVDEPVFTSFDKFIHARSIKPVTRAPGKTTIITPLDFAGAGREFVIKRYGFTHWYVRARSYFRRTVAVKELRLGREIERLGIPVSVPIAIAQRKRLGMVTECFVVIERLPGRVDLGEYLLAPERRSLTKEQIRERGRVIANLAAFMKRLHENGIYQYDCNLCNFLLEPQTLALTFIDLAKVSVSSSVPQSRRVENLSKLIRHRLRFSAADMALFLKVYCGQGREARRERHALAALVSDANRALLTRHFAREASECLREGRNFQSLRCAECSGILRKLNHEPHGNGEQLLGTLLQAARGAAQAGGRHAAAFKFDAGRGEETIWAFEGRYSDLEFTWRERNGLYPAGAWEEFPLGLCKISRAPERGMLFLVPSKAFTGAKPFLELSRAERRLLEEISQGVEGFEQE
jgi:tRNA A-37 threonylcarbamoyl transferase component Bud32